MAVHRSSTSNGRRCRSNHRTTVSSNLVDSLVSHVFCRPKQKCKRVHRDLSLGASFLLKLQQWTKFFKLKTFSSSQEVVKFFTVFSGLQAVRKCKAFVQDVHQRSSSKEFTKMFIKNVHPECSPPKCSIKASKAFIVYPPLSTFLLGHPILTVRSDPPELFAFHRLRRRAFIQNDCTHRSSTQQNGRLHLVNWSVEMSCN